MNMLVAVALAFIVVPALVVLACIAQQAMQNQTNATATGIDTLKADAAHNPCHMVPLGTPPTGRVLRPSMAPMWPCPGHSAADCTDPAHCIDATCYAERTRAFTPAHNPCHMVCIVEGSV